MVFQDLFALHTKPTDPLSPGCVKFHGKMFTGQIQQSRDWITSATTADPTHQPIPHTPAHPVPQYPCLQEGQASQPTQGAGNLLHHPLNACSRLSGGQGERGNPPPVKPPHPIGEGMFSLPVIKKQKTDRKLTPPKVTGEESLVTPAMVCSI